MELCDKLDLNPSFETLSHLEKHTGVLVEELVFHTLKGYQDRLPKSGGIVQNARKPPFILKLYSSRPQRSQIKYCPTCLEENVPFFRWYWRLGYYTACLKHKILLHDKCSSCSTPVDYFENDVLIDKCKKCGSSLHKASKIIVKVDIVEKIHNFFLTNNSPYFPKLSSSEFLEYFWKTYTSIFNRSDEYIKNLLKKFGEKYDPNNKLMIQHQVLSLVWKIFLKNQLTPHKLILCLECNSTFQYNSFLEKHIAYVHKTPSIQCSICGEFFPLQEQLKKHKKTHQQQNYFCIFCEAPFHTQSRMTLHINRKHSDQLQDLILNCIDLLKRKKQAITHTNIARLGNFSDTIFEKHEEYRNLVKGFLNELFVRFNDAQRLPENEKIIEEESVIVEAINKVISKEVNPSQAVVAKEAGLSIWIFKKRPNLSKIVKESSKAYHYRKCEMRISNAIAELIRRKKKIGYVSVVREAGIDYSIFKKYPSLKVLVDKSRPHNYT
jgi:hypothetical protein